MLSGSPPPPSPHRPYQYTPRSHEEWNTSIASPNVFFPDFFPPFLSFCLADPADTGILRLTNDAKGQSELDFLADEDLEPDWLVGGGNVEKEHQSLQRTGKKTH